VKNNRKHVIMANKEVIVSAGSVSSPQILMLSGIGPKEHLKSRGVCLMAKGAMWLMGSHIITLFKCRQMAEGSEKLQCVII
jgi:hypothetical protein